MVCCGRFVEEIGVVVGEFGFTDEGRSKHIVCEPSRAVGADQRFGLEVGKATGKAGNHCAVATAN
jgi:hypothetical protein